MEKGPAYAVKVGEFCEELEHYLGISNVKNVQVLTRYDIENLSEKTYRKALMIIFSEPPVNLAYEEEFTRSPGDLVFSVEYLPGWFDQRTDSAEQCVKFLKEDEGPVIRFAITYMVIAPLTAEQEEATKSFCINPVDSRQADEEKPETLVAELEVPVDILYFDGFADSSEEESEALYGILDLAMTFEGFLHIQNYYKKEERRDPSVTEIRVLDTYWSDYCRHTTFSTEFKNVNFVDGDYRELMEETYKQHLADQEVIYKERDDKYVCLTDLALIAMKRLRSEGKPTDMEIFDEINACSIVVFVEIDGVTEEWLVNFKNETHNHPTEIEPFGGATTCLDGAIRDPLSGRTHVYQAMRVTSTVNPIRPFGETLKGKLPQRKIVNDAAQGYSSYGNQIGLITGYVKETYRPGYVAKRIEIGVVMDAVPRRDVIREAPDPGDIIIPLDGRTSWDGIDGATGSSKAHTISSIEVYGAEVQEGNVPTERKIQRMFRRPEVSRIIKKCDDFGAGGIPVAIGELVTGLKIDLDKVPEKYADLDGMKIAISESRERVAVVVSPKDVDQLLAYASEEGLEAATVAVVTEKPRLKMDWRGKTIADLSRVFLDTNGTHQEADVTLEVPNRAGNLFDRADVVDVREKWLGALSDLNVCSQKGLMERFDGSIGAGFVFMSYGGRYQLTETQAMVAKLPVLKGHTDTVIMMSYGFDPRPSSWSSHHGAVYAVVSSVTKIVAAGGDYSGIRFTFQEHFRRMNENPPRWNQPFSAPLGVYSAQLGFGLSPIGGKDSMSGTLDTEDSEINAPPTPVSFAVDANSYKNVIIPEFKRLGSKIALFRIVKNQYDLPDYNQVMDGYGKIFEDIKTGCIISVYVVEGNGLAEAVSKTAFDNKLGVKTEHDVDSRDFSAAAWGDIICEVPEVMVGQPSISYIVISEATDRGIFEYGNVSITMDETLNARMISLEDVFPTAAGREAKGGEAVLEGKLYYSGAVYVCDHKIGQSTVSIPIFPGTNCEYDGARVFERTGAKVVIRVLRNMSAEDIRQPMEEYRKEIAKAQIVVFPDGFSAGDEPEGSAKFFVTVFHSAVMKEEIEKLLEERDGLILGICNGFQTLIRLGLLPEGEVKEQGTEPPTFATNTIGRHAPKAVYIKVASDKSPWLAGVGLGNVYRNPASRGEGRLVANESWLHRLFANGQVATQYVDDQGRCTMDEYWNPNGSYMAIEGIISPDGRILGKMAHSECRSEAVAMNIYGEQDTRIFELGVRYSEV